ncbi:hypothetical protein ACPPVW_12400 [Leifsonia sp. McL0607]|uniref:hypothetical protein n=1 Tax=Leifsonia sp. McL0607 TaxID=3415672 RepID=UPI003CF866BE
MSIARDGFDIATVIIRAVAAAATVFAVWVAVGVASQDSRDRRRLQATMVSAWQAHMDPRVPNTIADTVIVQNASTSAIYDVLLSWVGAWGNAKSDSPEYAPTLRLSMIPPGSWWMQVTGNPGGAMDARVGVLIEFSDGVGQRWMRTARGELHHVRHSDWLDKESREVNKLADALTRIARA